MGGNISDLVVDIPAAGSVADRRLSSTRRGRSGATQRLREMRLPSLSCLGGPAPEVRPARCRHQ